MEKIVIGEVATIEEDNTVVNNSSVYIIKRKCYFAVKRLFDIICSLILLPLVLLIMVIVKISYVLTKDYYPIIFKQKRTGKNGRNFYLYKFRTMVYDNDVYDLSKKDTYTAVGKTLRKLSIDELPQIFNILKGEMSFVGPRPWIVEYYQNMTSKQKHRCDVLPGITGLAQVKGRNSIGVLEKINYDLEYVKKISLKEDIKICILTVKAIFIKEGTNAGKYNISNDIKILKKQKMDTID